MRLDGKDKSQYKEIDQKTKDKAPEPKFSCGRGVPVFDDNPQNCPDTFNRCEEFDNDH
jgi:hypothetical protein